MEVFVLMETFYYYTDDGHLDWTTNCVGVFTSLARLRKYKKAIKEDNPYIKYLTIITTLDNPEG